MRGAALLLPVAIRAGVPYLRLEWQRQVSRAHRPQPMEIWSQDGALLYIESTDETGVRLISIDPTTHVITRWSDRWDEWAARCRARVVLHTGRSGSLNPWDAMRT